MTYVKVYFLDLLDFNTPRTMDNYHDITCNLDAREILRYLNDLGIQNISGEVLKHFITDLKKLIKYDLEQQKRVNEDKFEDDWPERLHSASTFCSRVRSRLNDDAPIQCCRESQGYRRPFSIRNTHSAPNIGHQPKAPENPARRACSCVRIEKKSERASVKESRATTTTSNNLIKIPKPQIKKKCDPVNLYHYYTTLWEKYKSNVPGENNWADLRWKVRQKMAGSLDSKVDTQSHSHNVWKETKHNKR